MEAYFDNSATTKVTESVKDIVVKAMTEDYGNPSSMHMVGVEAEKYIKTAKENIAKILKVDQREIYFNSGGTEGNNQAIIGVAEANKRSGNKIITTEIEHASVASPMKYLEKEGYQVVYLPVDHLGVVDMETLRQTNQSLIQTLDEVVKIQDEGRQKRREAEAEIGRLEGELKQKLLDIHT